MSAITGIFMRNGKNVDPELMKKMNDKLSHRGPDGSDIWCEGPIGLGHQMLWTTPESLHEQLPYEENGLIITADARIDNRDELSKELDIKDEENVSDSYFILKSYEKWGEECPDKLLGDFAFAIWDKAQEKLFCARDHMGVKPFYYYLDDDMFVFGTEIKAILTNKFIPNKLNEKKLALFLMRDILDDKLTFYENILSLVAASFLSIYEGKTLIEKYWQLDPNLQIILNSEEDYVNAFREIFIESVKCRLRSLYPIGFELSGGLDSSSIVCTAKTLMEEFPNLKINTFSNVYDEIPESDERYYIKKIVNDENFKSTLLFGDNTSPLENVDKILFHQDQPFFSPHMTNQINSYKEMNKAGIRILFSGEGGDEIVSHGGNYLREALFKFKFAEFIEELTGHSKNFNISVHKILFTEIFYPLIPYSIKKIIKSILKKNKGPILNQNLLEDLEVKKVDLDYTLHHIRKLTPKEYHYFSINTPLSQTVFGIIDRTTSCFNIEKRFPFYDKRLIEFCYGMPLEMKLKHGWDRYIMRLSMEDILPKEIQWRRGKTNLSSVYKRNLLLYEKDSLKEMIYDEKNKIRRYINLEMIQSIFKEYESGKETNLFELWLVLVLYRWINSRNSKK